MGDFGETAPRLEAAVLARALGDAAMLIFTRTLLQLATTRCRCSYPEAVVARPEDNVEPSCVVSAGVGGDER